ncbi:MAG TPA: hypothetical protein VKJ01_02825, partial [Candidatus Solibacter sp.]|nr:hypothetical protein [Candidatus Solibacter sp.]
MFTIGTTGVIRTAAGFGGSASIGSPINYSGGNMTLLNQGLISSQVSGRTITVNPVSFTNQGTGTVEAINGGLAVISATNWSNASGGILQALNGSTLSLSGAWSSAGTININSSTLNLGGSFTTAGFNQAAFTNTSGTINLTGALDNTSNTLTLNASTGSWTLNGGSITGGTVNFANGATLLFIGTANLLSGVAINGDFNLTSTSTAAQIAGGTTFVTAHLGAGNDSVAFAPGQTLTGAVLFEGANGARGVEMNGTTGMLTIANTGVVRTAAGFGGIATIGGGLNFSNGNMTLINNGLISSQVSGRTITVNPVSFTNQGTVEAINGGLAVISATNWSNASGGILQALNGSTLSLSGNWSNPAGSISINNSTLNLGGTFTTAGFNPAAFTNTAGTVNVTGTINNAGNTVTLNASTGSWTLNGGTFSGGTLNFANGASLLFVGTANLLTGVTINGDFTLANTSSSAQIAGGTTFVTAHLGAGNDSVAFAPGQTLTGAVLFEGALGGARGVEMNGTTGTLTIGNTGVIRTVAAFGGIASIGGGLNFSNGNMTLTNNGLISSQVSGRTITVNPVSFTNQGTVEAINGGLTIISATNWSNTTGGILQALNGSTLSLSGNWSNPAGSISLNNSTLNLGGTFTTTGFNPAAFTNTAGTVNITGTINNTGTTLTLNASTGSWTLSGGTISGGSLAFGGGQTLLFTN